MSAPPASAASICSREVTSTSTRIVWGIALLDRPDGGGEVEAAAPQGREVVVLHQHGVGQVEAVVVAAADPHRVLLQHAQPGRGLAGVDQPGGKPAQARDERRGRRRDAAQPLDEVQGRPLAGQQRARRPLDAGDDVARADRARRRAPGARP